MAQKYFSEAIIPKLNDEIPVISLIIFPRNATCLGDFSLINIMDFNFNNRQAFLKQLKTEKFDVVIIGGGVTGAGALLDAQSRGLKACLIEMQDFSQGTSSRSTKLIHGGLRYLKQFDLGLVAEVGQERNTLFKNAQHLTIPTEVIIPFEKGGSMNKYSAKLAMIAYEYLAKVDRKYKHTMLSKREVKNLLPSLDDSKLEGGVIYYEYKTNDSRLCIELLKTAVSKGAVALNYVKGIAFKYDDGKISGLEVEDQLTNERFHIKTDFCIASAGPWTDEILQLENEKLPNKVVLTKGVHIVFQQERFPLANAVYFEVGDGRMVFAIPKFDKVYVGTTDTFYNENKATPDINEEDADYIIRAINNKFKGMALTKEDVVAAWSGLRPLIKEEGKGESEISRKDEVFETESGLVAIAGGKLTGFRKMAEKVVNIVAKAHSKKYDTPLKECKTVDLPLLGSDADDLQTFCASQEAQNLTNIEKQKLYHWFGKQAYEVLKENTIDGLPDYIAKSLNYSLKYEMVTNPIDFLIHRIQLGYYDLDICLEYLPLVLNEVQKFTNSTQNIDDYKDSLTVLKDFKRL